MGSSVRVGVTGSAVAAVILAACGGDAPVGVVPFDPNGNVVAEVTVTPAAALVDGPGKTVQFTALVTDGAGNVLQGVDLTWASSDAGVASVDGSGLATSLGEGQAEIIARSGQVADTASLVVGTPP
jgi:hypothetical protein